jgi:hypothetical protein
MKSCAAFLIGRPVPVASPYPPDPQSRPGSFSILVRAGLLYKQTPAHQDEESRGRAAHVSACGGWTRSCPIIFTPGKTAGQVGANARKVPWANRQDRAQNGRHSQYGRVPPSPRTGFLLNADHDLSILTAGGRVALEGMMSYF